MAIMMFFPLHSYAKALGEAGFEVVNPAALGLFERRREIFINGQYVGTITSTGTFSRPDVDMDSDIPKEYKGTLERIMKFMACKQQLSLL